MPETNLSYTLAILSAMITPAVLISACGSLAISTANRLGRAIDRTRRLSERFREMVETQPDSPLRDDEISLLFDQLSRATRRARLLQRALTSTYLALTVFVATSVVIAVVAVSGAQYAWIPTALGMIGAGLLFYSSILLIAEARVARTTIDNEMSFLLRLGRHYAPKELVEQQRAHASFFDRFR